MGRGGGHTKRQRRTWDVHEAFPRTSKRSPRPPNARVTAGQQRYTLNIKTPLHARRRPSHARRRRDARAAPLL